MNSYFDLIDTKSLDEKIQSGIFPFTANLFWDNNIENIDLKKNQRYVIERVLTRGFTADFYILLKIYTSAEIKDALRKSKELDKKTLQFCSEYFKINKNEMHVSSFYR